MNLKEPSDGTNMCDGEVSLRNKQEPEGTDRRGAVCKLQSLGDAFSALLLERGAGQMLAKHLWYTGTAVQRLPNRAASNSQVDWRKRETTMARARTYLTQPPPKLIIYKVSVETHTSPIV